MGAGARAGIPTKKKNQKLSSLLASWSRDKKILDKPRLDISKLKTPCNSSYHHARRPVDPDHANISRQTTGSPPCSERLRRSFDGREESNSDGEAPKDTRSIHILLRRLLHHIPRRYQEPGAVAHDEGRIIVKPDRVVRISAARCSGMICEESFFCFCFSKM